MVNSRISIDSVLHDLSLEIPEDHWEDYKFTEWATKGARSIRGLGMLENKVALNKIKSHTFNLPDDLVYIIQVAVYTGNLNTSSDETLAKQLDLPDNFSTNLLQSTYLHNLWRPLTLATTPFASAIKCPVNIFPYKGADDCTSSYTVNSDYTALTTVKEGAVLIAYLAYAKDSNGKLLIPDLELLKDAISEYVLYKYWSSRAALKEQGASEQREYFRTLWLLNKAKVTALLNEPGVEVLENIRNMNNKFFSRNYFNNLFGKMPFPDNSI